VSNAWIIYPLVWNNLSKGELIPDNIPISPESPEEKIAAACLSLIKTSISPAIARQNLSAAKLELEGNYRIKISTAVPVNARSLKFQLKANCVPNGLVIREFNIELEPATNAISRLTKNSPPPVEKVDVITENYTGKNITLKKPDLNGSVRAGYFSSSRKLDERNDLATKKVSAYQKAMDIREQEHRKKESDLQKKEQKLHDDLKDKESQIKLMNQEVEYYRTKDNASKKTRENVTSMVSQLYDIKETKNKKKVEEGVDDMVEDILKKYRS